MILWTGKVCPSQMKAKSVNSPAARALFVRFVSPFQLMSDEMTNSATREAISLESITSLKPFESC